MVSDTTKAREQSQPSKASFPSFSVVMSHLMNTLDTYPLSQGHDMKQNVKGAQDLWNARGQWYPSNVGSVFEPKLQGQLFVVVEGVQDAKVLIPDYAPAFYVEENNPEEYVALAEDIATSTQERLGHGLVMHRVDLPVLKEFSSVVDSFKENYPEVDMSVFNLENEQDKQFIIELENARDEMTIFTDAKKDAEQKGTDFVVIHLKGLQAFLETYGATSEQYKEAQKAAKVLLEETLVSSFESAYPSDASIVSTLVLSPAGFNRFNKRALPSAHGKCYETKHKCESGTSKCSGRGVCGIVSDKCYACACQSGALGEVCEFVDVSSDFQLLFWTGVGLVLLTSGVLLFVYNSGNIDTSAILSTPHTLPKRE
ncbi:hypothetical protein BDF14DRAFT_1812661 [Spinellus fusiger]|nr:hypothetical protein BDF14DRAFT_1812661 [Spinellus fusiger]